jgi:hypothetical protein
VIRGDVRRGAPAQPRHGPIVSARRCSFTGQSRRWHRSPVIAGSERSGKRPDRRGLSTAVTAKQVSPSGSRATRISPIARLRRSPCLSSRMDVEPVIGALLSASGRACVLPPPGVGRAAAGRPEQQSREPSRRSDSREGDRLDRLALTSAFVARHSSAVGANGPLLRRHCVRAPRGQSNGEGDRQRWSSSEKRRVMVVRVSG